MGSQKDRKALGCIGRSVNDQPTNPVCGKSPIIELLNVSKICFVEKVPQIHNSALHLRKKIIELTKCTHFIYNIYFKIIQDKLYIG